MVSPLLANHPDDEIRAMQLQWYEAKDAWVAAGKPSSGDTRWAFDKINARLTKRLWADAEKRIEEERKKSPKLRKRSIVGSGLPEGERRHLP